MKTQSGVQNKMRTGAPENKVPVSVDKRVKVRLRTVPPGWETLTVPGDKVIECDAATAQALIERGFGDEVQ